MQEAEGLMTEEFQQLKAARPLLTIAIPTYNRARFLRELLSVLFDQLVSEPRVELIISDNASVDETPAVVQEYKERGLQIRCLRNDTNLGADGNILQCFEQASGKYVWIVGDDDVVATDAIAKILTCLGAEEYDLVYVSSYPFEGPSTPRASNVSREPTEIEDVEMFVRRVHVLLTFISGNIVNKDRVLASEPGPLSTLMDTHLVQLGWIYTALNAYARGLYIHEKLVGARINNTGGYKLVQTFGPNLREITEKWLQDRSLQRLIVNGTLQTFWPGMLLNLRNSSGQFEKEEAPGDILTPVFKDNFRYWIFVYPILITPLALAKCWLFVLRVLNRADKVLGSALMR
jgi:glycosyltransferase involved in cell wall biosynthesis